MQYVNLYQPSRTPPQLTFDVRMLVALVAVFALYLGGTVFFKHSDLRAKQARLEQLKEPLRQASTREATPPTAVKAINDAIFNARIEKAKAALVQQQNLQRLLQNHEAVNTTGFDAQLESLARAASAEISVSAFTFSDGGRQAAVYGVTTDPSLVPVYVSKLRAEPSFQDTRFGLMRVAQLENSPYHEFTLGKVSPAYGQRIRLR